MNTAGDSAEQIVKLSLEGMEVAFKIAGEGAKNIAVMLYAIMKENQQTKGKTRLTNMLKTGKELKIYSFKAEDLKKFSQEAKRYGVLYCALADKKNEKIDGIVDILIREEDASKVNRIAERFKFADIDRATIARDIEEQEKNGQDPQDKGVKQKSKDDILVDEILSKPIQKEKQQAQEVFPSFKNTEEKTLSEISLNISKIENEGTTEIVKKPSVKKELKELEQEVKKLEAKKELQMNQKTMENKEPKHLRTKEKKKAKHFKEYRKADSIRVKNKKEKKKER